MAVTEVVDLCSDDEGGNVGSRAAITSSAKKQTETRMEGQVTVHHRPHSGSTAQVSEENKSSGALSTCHSYSAVKGQGFLRVDVDDTNFSSPPICRNFWKAGNYDDDLLSKLTFKNSENYLHVHPLFLHSNATSHKWAFGAIAELIDNAVDEIQNGATSVVVDKILNPKDGSPALLIQDDGGGMDPEVMRQCMSFGFSDKSKIAIGQYGNGFKTGSMRLVDTYCQHFSVLSTIVMIWCIACTFFSVNYKFDTSTEYLEILNDEDHFRSNLSILLHWSPYLSEDELLKQFGDIGSHGTKIIIFNLWFNGDGNLELDFDSDPEDVRISGDIKKVATLPGWKTVNEEYIANRYHYSLRAYLSMLYLGIRERFKIVMRGKVVNLHNIADDLKYTEYVLYKPHRGGPTEVLFFTNLL
ncbi:unnamed protein product [Sphenostylis stenocarpa]|uniref:Morc S5 domain-containing protein n=1 Tax=Sphenostylis stenocarpa TaxID=92480 RepID=A0AA86S6B7_9FABA|nr:unnamed protein product [Sphenostylis stenocarpa]